MPLYTEQFSDIHDYPRVDKPSKVVIIASTQRCGSHMLGHALHTTNKFGFPLEYLNLENLSEWKRRLAITDTQAVIKEIQKRRTSPNGVFSIKIHYSQIRHIGGLQNLLNTFPNAYYILLSRKDVLRQAVSLSIADQTGVWIAGQEAINTNPEYDFELIDQCLRSTILQTASWRYSLAANGLRYTEVYFEEVRSDLDSSIRQIAAFTGVDVNDSEIPGHQITKDQSNRINEEWEKRFLRDFNHSRELLVHQNQNRLITKLKKKLYRAIRSR